MFMRDLQFNLRGFMRRVSHCSKRSFLEDWDNKKNITLFFKKW